MKLRDITEALSDGDNSTMRLGFRTLVDPHATVEASSPGMLVVALNRLCVALKDDQAEMPAATCGALDLPPGSTYSEGSAAAKREATRLARHLMAAT
ncbi:hypothetical protein [Bosea sp. ANAM02]|uniref:hypothetical protein n=1 Tax=Bosea sp. ANAM02 TaxID=2020412 RepID=UPI00140EC268|nr:hypothetical protein [Bosea sp. ANAM02]BCB17896.1 hypothetical protein OCUBac02_07900 [Bosea sp. ANAM02]